MNNSSHDHTAPNPQAAGIPDVAASMAALEANWVDLTDHIRRLRDFDARTAVGLDGLLEELTELADGVFAVIDPIAWTQARLGTHGLTTPAVDLSDPQRTHQDSTSSPRATDHTGEAPGATASPEPPAGSRP
ncbi:hypothetical protein ALI22I_20170 [Saccharothrix sp. ALI-22-I]|uniref:hypothetical protein n=1 Tax=Saccharothrix sp. ALI-22-I TaxID=1933778 RepID=UPI00097C93A2|nr:hypothetical protein [Saccharothrix sp. ALI-22-I]ONI88059.1 hypothetical protein ALI22I_20170 [Saccharothrix sp. ALI-22-I]